VSLDISTSLSTRLVATDLDGTLVRDDRTISPYTADVLQRVAADGIAVVLVTGRPIRWLHNVYSQLATCPIAVCANGAVVYEPVRDEILHATSLTPDALAEACARLRATVPGVLFAVERDGGRRMLHEPAYPIGPWEMDHADVHPAPFAELIRATAAKLLVRPAVGGSGGTVDADDFTALVATTLTGIAEATNSSSSGVVEVSAAGVTKAYGLAWVAESLGVAARDVIAFGDMPNDLPMLAWAGRGVAMANGHPAVRAAAHDVTARSNEDDGVAAYLESRLL
jgi:hydroxymethylpyrimidine pyrophosphatase-like HAD family hydrolase